MRAPVFVCGVICVLSACGAGGDDDGIVGDDDSAVADAAPQPDGTQASPPDAHPPLTVDDCMLEILGNTTLSAITQEAPTPCFPAGQVVPLMMHFVQTQDRVTFDVDDWFRDETQIIARGGECVLVFHLHRWDGERRSDVDVEVEYPYSGYAGEGNIRRSSPSCEQPLRVDPQ